MLDPEMLKKWLARRKGGMPDMTDGIGLPNGMTIHIHVNTGETEKPDQKIPLTADGKAVATRDAVARYPG